MRLAFTASYTAARCCSYRSITLISSSWQQLGARQVSAMHESDGREHIVFGRQVQVGLETLGRVSTLHVQ